MSQYSGGMEFIMEENIKDRIITEVCKAKLEDKAIMVNLLSLYLHEFSEYNKFVTISDDGSFHYDEDIEYLWNEENYIPYFIKVNQKIIGFVILMKNTPEVPNDCDYDMCEFFVIKPYRGKGIGRMAANQIFDLHPGRYHVVELINNKSAIDFWHNVYSNRGLSYEEKEKDFGQLKGIYQKFHS
jgi:predicted acetyltransferase